MRDELADKTIDNSFKIGRNHPMIQQRRESDVTGVTQRQELSDFTKITEVLSSDGKCTELLLKICV
ncbi:hypothetical protein [Nostoc sp.]|uniref:hypothetical protein n=1 Tax=Nostoc sp. TaxID=1180 RepID=UPI002FF797AF